MEIDQLRYFLRVAERGSFTRAAAELGISQPALSRSIQKLEDELGQPVFERKARSVSLTDAGLLLQSRVQHALTILEDAKAEITDDGQSGRVRIGAIPTVAPFFLPKVLQQFAEEHPKATVLVQENTTDVLLKSCVQGELDLAILALPISAKYLEVEELFEEELLLVVPPQHPLATKPQVRLADIEPYPFVLLDEAHCLSDNIVSFCRQRSIQPVPVERTSQLAMVQELVALSHGISMIPEMARKIDPSDRRVYRSLSGKKPTRKLAVVWNPYRFQSRLLKSLRQALVLATLMCGLLGIAIGDNRVQAGEHAIPNFIVVFCDNLGYGDIEPFGSELHRTPNLNQMAREGRKFTSYYVTAGVCTPSRASLMTGCYAQRVGMHWNPRDGQVLRPLSPYGLHPEEVTIAEVLRSAGYATAMIGKWHLGDQPEFLPTRQGFDSFFGVPYSDDMTADVGKRIGDKLDGNRWPPLPLMEGERVIEAPCDRDTLTRRYTERAVEWIREHRQQPFFLYLPHAMPGSTAKPFASDSFRGQSRNGAWGDSVEELDWSIGKILDALRSLDLEQKTLVIWTSDNGAPLARNLEDLSRGSNRPLHGRGYTTSEGGFRVPMIAWQPGTVPANSECSELATTMDLLPTFAKLANVTPATRGPIDGRDISLLLFGKPGAISPHDRFYYYHQQQLHAVRSGPWKLFVPLSSAANHPHFPPSGSTEPLLFNLVNDVGSQQNVAAKHPEIVASLLEMAEQAKRDLGEPGRQGRGQRSAGRITGSPTARVMATD